MPQRGRRQADQLLLVALACGATVEAAAQKAGLSQATVYRRLRDPEFKKRIQDVQSDMVKRASGTLTAAGMEAIKTLLALLQSSSTPAGVRLGAARAVLELGGKLRDSVELEERLRSLEERVLGNGEST
jgi:AcrR family transcriptional regulator